MVSGLARKSKNRNGRLKKLPWAVSHEPLRVLLIPMLLRRNEGTGAFLLHRQDTCYIAVSAKRLQA